VREPPLVLVHGRHRVQQLDPRPQPGTQQHLVHHALGAVELQADALVTGVLGERPHLPHVGPQVRADQVRDVVVGDRLAPRHQREARREPLQVPREAAEVGLVEVVDVEHQGAGRVHVGAEVLRVQVALDPHPAGPLVRPRVLVLGHVRVEQARGAAVEGERRGRHLPELAPERDRVGLHELVERADQHVDDLRLARVSTPLGDQPGDTVHCATVPQKISRGSRPEERQRLPPRPRSCRSRRWPEI
jgi:hypothetical protein